MRGPCVSEVRLSSLGVEEPRGVGRGSRAGGLGPEAVEGGGRLPVDRKSVSLCFR